VRSAGAGAGGRLASGPHSGQTKHPGRITTRGCARGEDRAASGSAGAGARARRVRGQQVWASAHSGRPFAVQAHRLIDQRFRARTSRPHLASSIIKPGRLQKRREACHSRHRRRTGRSEQLASRTTRPAGFASDMPQGMRLPRPSSKLARRRRGRSSRNANGHRAPPRSSALSGKMRAQLPRAPSRQQVLFSPSGQRDIPDAHVHGKRSFRPRLERGRFERSDIRRFSRTGLPKENRSGTLREQGKATGLGGIA